MLFLDLKIPVGSTNLHLEDVEDLEAARVDFNKSVQSSKNSEDTNDGASQSAVILHVKKSSQESSNDKDEKTAPLIKTQPVLGFRMTPFHWAYMALISVHLVWMVLGTIWTIPIFIRSFFDKYVTNVCIF